MRALVLADHEVNRRVLREQIIGWGMRAGSFAAGEQALAEMRAAYEAGDAYRFVLLDCPAPDGDGIRLAHSIHADLSLRGCAIVLLSAIGQCQEIGQTQSGVIDACLGKPVRQSQLFHTLASAWAKREGVQPPGNFRAKPNVADLKRADFGKFACSSRILVAEDNVVNQKVACRLLESLGLRTDVAADGQEAVEMCALVPYDLILMDCQMPEKDGYEATREIRSRLGATRQVTVIAMTADAMSGSRERCLEAGMDDYISKPVKLHELYATLSRWLPQKQSIPP
jgi:CheY-like chemotaxis protein